ncbi:Protein arginine N-methyltransferase 5 [Ceratocystis fimbriata CBS 114723]|uniref:Protein arginine N-methyltransferase n=1 Tax=Ceratocystis fimbriata CBS 114723 TaxID=1035309 RepID=A0A2C5X899_9PEZI|nr:Protein arginine N-methyltransferase 5 [Ceratocystis fimbriata CBS 114723]
MDYNQAQEPTRPRILLGYHDSSLEQPLNDLQYGKAVNQGISYLTSPITNSHFHQRITELVKNHLQSLKEINSSATADLTAAIPDPIIPPLTTKDTSLFPSFSVSTYNACTSSWIDLASPDPVIANISRQVLNLELAYATWCGVRSIVIHGPRQDSARGNANKGLAQYARAIREALTVASRQNITIHMPMYREPGLDDSSPSLTETVHGTEAASKKSSEIALFSAWDSWHFVRTFCEYNPRLFVGVRMPKVMAEKELQTRWFAEPLNFISMSPEIFQANKAGFPSLPKHHQELIFSYMRLKTTPWVLLCDIDLDLSAGDPGDALSKNEFPTLADSVQKADQRKPAAGSSYISYMQWLESQQNPYSNLENSTFISFQDWLQSPLQPLSDNLESATYEVFEGDPVKYNQYEAALVEALTEWKALNKPTSSKSGAVVVAVAGSGRGPLVTRALSASKTTGVPIEAWAVEKNPNAYVYLLRQNEFVWERQVTVVKTDMRAWKGPLLSESTSEKPVYGKVDILVSELLGSFGDNELSPECLDGIQHVLAKPHGISIPHSYTAHLTPLSTPKLHQDILHNKVPIDPHAFSTPYVVQLYSHDFVCDRGVPGHARFQQTWEFSHPISEKTLALIEARKSGGVIGGGGGSMAGAAGVNDHNYRQCHLTFVARNKGVVHGLGGYFESTLYQKQIGEPTKIEISILPEQIDKKSKDMTSWFPIYFPLTKPIDFPADSEIEVFMWRQTNDTKVWYEWQVEAYTWIGENQRIKIGTSELCSSYTVACLM